MVRKSVGHSNSKNNLKFKNKNGKFKTNTSKHTRDRFKKKTSNFNAKNMPQVKEKKDFKKYNKPKPSQNKTNIVLKSKEDISSSESEPDAFSELVSCFTNTSNKISAVSDEDTETESELENLNDDQLMAEDDLSAEDNSNDDDSESDAGEPEKPSSNIPIIDEVSCFV